MRLIKNNTFLSGWILMIALCLFACQRKARQDHRSSKKSSDKALYFTTPAPPSAKPTGEIMKEEAEADYDGFEETFNAMEEGLPEDINYRSLQPYQRKRHQLSAYRTPFDFFYRCRRRLLWVGTAHARPKHPATA